MLKFGCEHKWRYNFPCTLTDLIVLDETLLQLALSVSRSERTCEKCGKAQIYEPPHVCGGSKWRWCDAPTILDQNKDGPKC